MTDKEFDEKMRRSDTAITRWMVVLLCALSVLGGALWLWLAGGGK